MTPEVETEGNWNGNVSIGINEIWYGVWSNVVVEEWSGYLWYRLGAELQDPGISMNIIDFYCYSQE